MSDPVFGTCYGVFAEYATESVTGLKSALIVKPDNVTFEQAASAPVAGLTAMQALRDKARIEAGQKVLVNGAAGGVGIFALQIAKSWDANVTAVCSARKCGPGAVYRRRSGDRLQRRGLHQYRSALRRRPRLHGDHSFSEWRRVLNLKGSFVGVGAPRNVSSSRLLASLIGALVRSLFVSQKQAVFMARFNEQNLTNLGELIATGKVTSVIDRRYRLSEARDAFLYMEEGHARGRVVITPEA